MPYIKESPRIANPIVAPTMATNGSGLRVDVKAAGLFDTVTSWENLSCGLYRVLGDSNNCGAGNHHKMKWRVGCPSVLSGVEGHDCSTFGMIGYKQSVLIKSRLIVILLL